MNKELLIIIPAYNEEESIGNFLDELLATKSMDYADILVINDASSDHTEDIVRKKGITITSHPYNLGYGASLQTGYKYAVRTGYKYVIQMDSDGQHDPKNIHRIYEKLKDNSTGNPSDIIIGSRFLKDSISFPVSRMKRLAIGFFRFVIKTASNQNITDPTSGLQGLNRKTFSFYANFENFDPNYPDANMLVQMALLGYQIQEIPAIMHERKAGVSMHLGIIKPMLYMLIMIFSTFNVILRHHLHYMK